MLIALLLAAQAAAPDIELEVRATARDVRVERSGTTSLELRASPDAGTNVDVEGPREPGRRRLRNVTVRVKAEARVGDPRGNREPRETESPQ